MVMTGIAQDKKNDIGRLIAQRMDWPSHVTLQKPVNTTLFNKQGKRLGTQEIDKGRKLAIHGVYKQGVALKIGNLVAFVAPDATDIIEGIKNVQRKKDLMQRNPGRSNLR